MSFKFSEPDEEEYQEFLEEVKKGFAMGGPPPGRDDTGRLVLATFLLSYLKKKPVHKNILRLFAFAVRAILEGENPEYALGLNRSKGRSRGTVLRFEVPEYISKLEATGISRNKAIDAAADYFHKDRRHIQRIIAEAKKIEFLTEEDHSETCELMDLVCSLEKKKEGG